MLLNNDKTRKQSKKLEKAIAIRGAKLSPSRMRLYGSQDDIKQFALTQLEETMQGILLLNHDMHIIKANRALGALLSCNMEEYAFTHVDTLFYNIQPLCDLLSEGRKFENIVCRLHTSRDRYDMLVTGGPLYNHEGQPGGSWLGFYGLEQMCQMAGAMDLSPGYAFHDILGDCDAVRLVKEQCAYVAAYACPVLLVGERGTQKYHFARAIHRLSARSEYPFFVFDARIEREAQGILFGCVQDGAHTKGLLHKVGAGTLYIQNIQCMPLDMQRQLYITLTEEGADVTARLIAGVHCDLADLINTGAFDPQLFEWLSEISIAIPSLSERKDDLFLHIDHCLKRHNKLYEKNVHEVEYDALEMLFYNDWKENMEEFSNAMEAALLLCESEVLLVSHFIQAGYAYLYKGGEGET